MMTAQPWHGGGHFFISMIYVMMINTRVSSVNISIILICIELFLLEVSADLSTQLSMIIHIRHGEYSFLEYRGGFTYILVVFQVQTVHDISIPHYKKISFFQHIPIRVMRGELFM